MFTPQDERYMHCGLMPSTIRKYFEDYVAKKLPAEKLASLKDYIEKHGRLKVINAVKEIRPEHLDAIVAMKLKWWE